MLCYNVLRGLFLFPAGLWSLMVRGYTGFGSLIVRDCTWLWFVNGFSLVFIVMATALFLLLSKPCYAMHLNACATLGTEPKKAPYAITGVILCVAHKVRGGSMIITFFFLVLSLFFLLFLFFLRPFKNGVKKFTEWSVKQRTRWVLFYCPFMRWLKYLPPPNDSMFVVAQCSKF